MKDQENRPYRSRWEAYPFLPEAAEDLRCDYEIASDRLAGSLGWLAALLRRCLVGRQPLTVAVEPGTAAACQWLAAAPADLETLSELCYHANAGLRTPCRLTEEEIAWLDEITLAAENILGERQKQFVVTVGHEAATAAHIVRCDTKQVLRLLYRAHHAGSTVDPRLIDFFSRLAAYIFALSLLVNLSFGVPERRFVSRNYPQTEADSRRDVPSS
ncbi:MAG: ATP:cob(I)alamin adenosyltransferase [Bacillota bacterium]|nr:ATP:cob(I)alamin adenosyltransferase [Bacillota bacterium]